MVLTLLAATTAFAQAPSSFQDKTTQPASQVNPADLSNVGIDQRLNQQVPLDLEFKDETGKTVRLGDYFQSGRPVILNLVYYTCPMLCGEELAGEASALSMLKFTPGNEYEVVSVSFNPDETPKDAADKKQIYIARMNEHLDHKTNGDGWHFLTGEQPQIKQLADAVGFHYHRDPRTGQFIHAAGIMIVTPTGKIAQYYYGVEFSPNDIRLGLIEASRDKIGTVVDQVLLYCYHYDPSTGRYGAVVTNIMRLAGAATMLILGGFLIVMFRRDKHDGSEQGNRTGLIDMWKNFPLFPERASALAWQVDGLYFLLIAVSAFFTLLIFVLIFIFAVKYRRSVHPHPVQIEGSLPLELAWTLIPLGICMIFFAWGSLIYFQEARPPKGAMEVYAVGKQWMWKFEHESGQREINQLHVPVGADVKHDHEFAGRDPQLLRAGFPHQGRRAARPVYHDLVSYDEGRHLSFVLLAILRHRSLGHDRPGNRDGADAYQAWLSSGGGATATLAAQRPAAVHAVGMRDLPPLRYPGARPESGRRIW